MTIHDKPLREHSFPLVLKSGLIHSSVGRVAEIRTSNFDTKSSTVFFKKNASINELIIIQKKLSETNPTKTSEELQLVLLSYSQVDDFDIITIPNTTSSLWIEALSESKFEKIVLSDITIPQLNQPGLFLMDMDSTAIQIECIDEIAKIAGVGDSVSAITERAMQGELDFEQSLRLRVNQLKGASETILADVLQSLPITSGLDTLVKVLLDNNWKVAIASGGFTYFADSLKRQLNLTEVFANQLEIIDGILTGNLVGKIIDAKAKADILNELAHQHNISPTQTIAIGDGANDLPMLQAATLGIAFHAKPKVVEKAKVAIKYSDLSAVLVYFYISSILS